MALKFDRRLRSFTADTPAIYQSHQMILKINLANSRLNEVWESQLILPFLSEMHPWTHNMRLAQLLARIFIFHFLSPVCSTGRKLRTS